MPLAALPCLSCQVYARDTNFEGADLTNSVIDRADLSGANLKVRPGRQASRTPPIFFIFFSNCPGNCPASCRDKKNCCSIL